MSIACSHPMSMAERCAVASELLDSLAQIPTAYMLAISAPFVSFSVPHAQLTTSFTNSAGSQVCWEAWYRALSQSPRTSTFGRSCEPGHHSKLTPTVSPLATSSQD